MTRGIGIPGIGIFDPRDARSEAATRRTVDLVMRHGRAAFGRDAEIGHVTASGFVVSPDRTRTLLMHHLKLDRWLQPGGHCDGEPDVRLVAATEVSEETGLWGLHLLNAGRIFDIDVHEIPARGDEPAHFHHDIRFLFEADPATPLVANSESKGLAWVDRTALGELVEAPSVRVIEAALA